MLIPFHIGFICAERVPDVDRAAEDLKIFLVAIIAEFADLQVKTEKLLSIDEVSDAEIPLRTVLLAAKDMCSACAYLAAHHVDAAAILVRTLRNHGKMNKIRLMIMKIEIKPTCPCKSNIISIEMNHLSELNKEMT
ncbi:hypothetical protein T4A_1609 [Trichinella pseudospiralis]|uniref:Uncharacterized protein n=1 Tax=Trichinella pseudospiralis TaxID=6337 RepID=A0A0V1E9H0_TRIPS|nr:hypothetical protein T4A_1609 [Trichinella pseudospiralis]